MGEFPKSVGSLKNSSKHLTLVSVGCTINPEHVTGQKLKDMIKRPNSLKKPIFAVDTPDNCFAQILANELHTTVYAPTKKLYANPDGTIFVGKKKDGFLKDFIWRE